jgi:hypothetical protein
MMLPRIAQRSGASVDDILLAAISKVCRDLLEIEIGATTQGAAGTESGKDVVSGLYLANRAVCQDDLSSIVSPTPNLLPIRISSTGSLAQTAQRVRSDLQKLSSVDTAASSMAEIHAWTSVRVNCFVNILKPSNNDAAAQSPSTQFLEECGQGARWRRAEIVELQCDPLATEKSKSRVHEVDSVSDFPSVMHGSHRAWKDA